MQPLGIASTSLAARAIPRWMARRLSPWMVILAVALVYCAVTLSMHRWDPMSFVLIGGRFDPTVANTSYGYDGQFAYQIARDPLNGWKFVDVPAYRYQRILYPLLARALSFGQPAWIPWVLILINGACIVWGTRLLEHLLARYGVSRWLALVYGLFVGTLMSLRLDLTEPLAFLLVFTAILAFQNEWYVLSAFGFAGAALTREITLLFAAACGIVLLTRRRFRLAIGWGLIAGLPFVLWQIILKLWLGNWGVGSGGALATPFEMVPFHGWWGMLSINPTAFWVMSLLVAPMAILPAVASLAAGGLTLARGKGSLATWALLLNALVIPFLPMSNILDPLGLSRITIGLLVAVLLYGGETRSSRALSYACLWMMTVVFLYGDAFLPVR